MGKSAGKEIASKGLGRWIYGLLLLTVWALAFVLAAELGAVVCAQVFERNNFWICERKAGRIPVPEPVLGDVPVPCSDQFLANHTLPGSVVHELRQRLPGTLKIPKPLPWAVPRQSETTEERRERRAGFDALGEEDRYSFARLHSEVIAEVNPDSGTDLIYGRYPAIQKMRKVFQAEYRAVPALLPLWEAIEKAAWNSDASPCLVTVGLDPAILFEVFPVKERPARAHVFVNLKEWRKGMAAALPPDSPWETPFYRYKPNLRDAYSGLGVTFSTNNLGFRDDHVTLPKPLGTVRIVCVGGSTTEEGDTNDLTYPNLLEAHLCRRFPNTRIEVINCGVSGLDTPAHLERLPDYFALEPDLLLFYEGVNDIAWALPGFCHNPSALPPFLLEGRNALDRLHGRLSRAWSWPGRLAQRSRLIRFLAPAAFDLSEERMREETRRCTVANLRTILQAARERGIAVALCSVAYASPEELTREERRYFEYDVRVKRGEVLNSHGEYAAFAAVLNQELHALCVESGAGYIPVAECLQGGIDILWDICHLTQPAIEQKALIVFRSVEDWLEEALSASDDSGA